jgi:hypothetical protein
VHAPARALIEEQHKQQRASTAGRAAGSTHVRATETGADADHAAASQVFRFEGVNHWPGTFGTSRQFNGEVLSYGLKFGVCFKITPIKRGLRWLPWIAGSSSRHKPLDRELVRALCTSCLLAITINRWIH